MGTWLHLVTLYQLWSKYGKFPLFSPLKYGDCGPIFSKIICRIPTSFFFFLFFSFSLFLFCWVAKRQHLAKKTKTLVGIHLQGILIKGGWAIRPINPKPNPFQWQPNGVGINPKPNPFNGNQMVLG